MSRLCTLEAKTVDLSGGKWYESHFACQGESTERESVSPCIVDLSDLADVCNIYKRFWFLFLGFSTLYVIFLVDKKDQKCNIITCDWILFRFNQIIFKNTPGLEFRYLLSYLYVVFCIFLRALWIIYLKYFFAQYNMMAICFRLLSWRAKSGCLRYICLISSERFERLTLGHTDIGRIINPYWFCYISKIICHG